MTYFLRFIFGIFGFIMIGRIRTDGKRSTTIALIMSIIKEKCLFFGAISFFRFKKQSWPKVMKSDVYVLKWWLAAVAGEYTSTSLVVWAFL